ncbi:uncharacterized protein VP01_3911g5 [Puccinia sorghi]|uniref:Uncharacterized protein n=1 Tax=Puccinia sorghi TaxID=27349 RepID=A0A0L6USQ4_9BASI|nr:uncharacterized protein VP01_3911g5 [Puccinia sorghi]
MANGVCSLASEFWDSVEKIYEENDNTAALLNFLKSKQPVPDLVARLKEPWKKNQAAGMFVLLDGLLFTVH